MWPFRNKKSEAERAIAILDEAIEVTAEKWLFFSKSLAFKDDVQLAEKIGIFSVPMYEGMRKNLPPLRGAPDAVLLMIIAKGIEKSGTHSRTEIEQTLGIPLPE